MANELTTETRAVLRARYRQAAAWCGWSEQDRAEISGALAAAVQAGDAATLALWRDWLEALAGTAEFAPRCRALEARIRAARAVAA